MGGRVSITARRLALVAVAAMSPLLSWSTTHANDSATDVADGGAFTAQSAPASFSPFPATGHFHPAEPTRLLDTRDDTGGHRGAVGPSQVIELAVTDIAGIPGGASAVVLNVTVAEPTADGFVTVFPAGGAAPNTSNLNFVTGASTPNLVVVKTGAGGKVALFNSAGNSHLIADVMGWYDDWFDPSAGQGASLVGVTPSRILDTRTGNGVADRRPRGGGEITSVVVRGRGNVPNDASVNAVVMNVTAVRPSEGGYLTVFPSGTQVPQTSNVNFGQGRTVANLVMVKLGSDGAVGLFNYAGNTDVVFDVVAYTTTADTNGAGQFFPMTPVRVLDTRDGLGSTTGRGPIGAGATKRFDPVRGGGLPTSGVGAVVLNVTAVKPTADGFLTVHADDQRPSGDASNVNFVVGDVVPNLVVSNVGTSGGVEIDNFAGNTDVVVDLVGWFSAPAAFDVRSGQAIEMAIADQSRDAVVSHGVASSMASADVFSAEMLANARGVELRDRDGRENGPDIASTPGGVSAAAGGFQPDLVTWAAGFASTVQLPQRTAASPGPTGRLYISLDDSGGTGTCSGTVIDADLVLTAAHCVYDADQPSPHFYRAWGFVPGQFGPVSLSLPTAVNPQFWVTSATFVRAEYATVNDPWFGGPGLSSMDYAVVRFAPKLINGTLTHLADVAGSIPVQVNAPLGARLVLGYPSGFASPQFANQCADAANDECYPYFCFSPVTSYWLNDVQPGLSAKSSEIGLGCSTPQQFPNGPAPGASGGPWLTSLNGQWRVTSVTSNGPVVADQSGRLQYLRNLWGPYLDERATVLIDHAREAT